MRAIIEAILTEPATWVAVLILAAGRIYFTRLVTRGVDQRFDKRLETHRHSLQLATERARHAYQRELADFNLYAVRRHEAAASVYKALRIAHGYVSNLFGGRDQLTFEDFNREDIAAHMTSLDVPGGKQEEILAAWDDDKGAAIRDLRPYLRVMEVQRAEAKLIDARNEAIINELYLTDEAILAIDEVVKIMYEWLGHVKYPDPDERWRPDEPALTTALEQTHHILRGELRGEGAREPEGLAAPPANAKRLPGED